MSKDGCCIYRDIFWNLSDGIVLFCILFCHLPVLVTVDGFCNRLTTISLLQVDCNLNVCRTSLYEESQSNQRYNPGHKVAMQMPLCT